MDAPAPNPLLSTQTDSQLQAILHPLVLLTISDYITRHTLRQQQGPIIGALLGQQNGRGITIEHAFECQTTPAPDSPGGWIIEQAHFAARLEQMITVHKDRNLDLVGWYTLLPPTGPTQTTLSIHKQILFQNESAILLGFHPQEVLSHSVGGKLPLTIYESNFEVDEPKHADDEDKTMDDGDQQLRIKFRELPYSVESDETEMISMNYVAAGGGNAAASGVKPTSVEKNGKGKRRLVESGDTKKSEAVDRYLSRHEDEMISSLTTKANAIKMLQSRIQLLVKYLDQIDPEYDCGEDPNKYSSDAPPSLNVLRQIQAVVSRLPLVIPSDRDAFDKEVLRESNDVQVLNLLSDIMESITETRETGKKFNVVESAKALGRRQPGDGSAGIGQMMNMARDLVDLA